MAVEHQVGLPANPSTEDILNVLGRVYMNPGVSRVVVEGGSVRVQVEGEDTTPLLTQELLTPDDVLGRLDMEEAEEGESPYKTLFDMFLMVGGQGLEVSHILTGSLKALRRWLGLPPMVSVGGRLLGVRVQRVDTLPEDVLLVVGSPRRGLELGYARFAVKISMGKAE